MARRWLWAGVLPAVAAALLLTPDLGQARGWGGGFGRGMGGYGWGGYGGYGWGGYGGWGNYAPNYGGYYSGYSPYGYGWGTYPTYTTSGYTVPNYNYYWGNNQGYYNNNYPYYTNYSNGAQNYQSFYPSSANNVSHVRVEVPANAEVWFGGHKTMQTGTDRLFVSPPLDPKKNYNYEVRARWMENGQMVDRTQNVPVSAGQTETVNFLQGQGAERSATAPANEQPARTGQNPPAVPRGETPTSNQPQRP